MYINQFNQYIIYVHVEGNPTTLQGCDKILESLATGTKTTITITSQYNMMTFQPGSCNKVSHTNSQLIHTVQKIAYPMNNQLQYFM